MRRFKNKISEIINQCGFNLNNISKTSGVSHTYLTKLVNGRVNRPGKDKLASILLSLNYSVDDINKVLAEYDYRELDRPDIPSILFNNRKRKIEGNTLSLYDQIHMRLLLSPMERLGGTKILVKGTPSVLYMPDELYLMRDRTSLEGSQGFCQDLQKELLKERKSIFAESFKSGNRFETYICKNCLADYLEKNLNGNRTNRNRRLTVQYFANAMISLKNNPDQNITKIVERCTYFDFQIQGADLPTPKVFFMGRKPHHYRKNSQKLNLKGFTSDAPAMIGLFMQETKGCRQAADQLLEESYPNHLLEYMVGLFKPFKLDDRLLESVHQKETRENL